MSVNVCIFGVSGYTGSTLLKFLDKHKSVNLVGVFGNKTLGKKIRILFPKLSHLPNIKISDFKKFNFDKVDLIFTDLNSKNTKIDLKKVTDKPTCVIIGPEGDFSEEERAKILKFSGVQPLKINENILRSETAVISAISIIKYAIN